MTHDDIITSQERVAQLNKDEEPIDNMIEIIVKTIIVTLTAVLMVYGLIMWIHAEDFSDTGVGCVDECLKPEVTK
jgi:hypothetical protein